MRELSGNGLFAAAEQQLPRIETLEYNQKNWKILFSSSSSSLLYSFFFLPPKVVQLVVVLVASPTFLFFFLFNSNENKKIYTHKEKRIIISMEKKLRRIQ